MDVNLLVKITGGKAIQFVKNWELDTLATDSRKVSKAGTQFLFITISGLHHDGHDFLGDLYQKGIRNFIVEKQVDISNLVEANVILVKNSVKALQEIATYRRSQFDFKVIGITGSNGKTIVKEWLFKLLSRDLHVLRSPKSFNSQIGVPLSVWQLSKQHEIAIFEAGISQTGEMEALERVIKPSIGIFTNIGSAHDLGFASQSLKVQEKLKLFSACELLIYCEDQALVKAEIRRGKTPQTKLLSWSFNHESDMRMSHVSNAQFSIVYQSKTYQLQLPYTDSASQENLFHCITYLVYIGHSEAEIQESLNRLEPIRMRLELRKGINNSYLVDDTYNNDLVGLKMALEFLESQSHRNSKTLILSDILQSITPPGQLYAEVAELLYNNRIDRLVAIGPDLNREKRHFKIPSHFYTTTQEFLEELDEKDFEDQLVLVKGARPFQFEKIVSRLAEQIHETVLEIDLDALTHNYNFYRSQLKPNTKIMVMVKAFAYGSGGAEISNLLQFHKADYLAVAYTDEAIVLRKNGIYLPIMVMNPKDDLSQLLEYDLQPEVFSLGQIDSIVKELEGQERSLKIHININTGMNRLGFEPHEIDKALQTIKTHPKLEVESIFTHLAGADEEKHRDFSLVQLGQFKEVAAQVEQTLGYKLIKHALNSAGIVSLPAYQLDMVRLGIGLHGFDPTGKNQATLIPVSTFKTIISQVKEIKKGESIGYSRKGMAEKDLRIATIALGYADGFSRVFGNGIGKVLIKGQSAEVIGNVCMDMTMVDVSHIEVKEGDEVIIFGKELPIKEIADLANTIPYEILTNVSSRVKRVYFSS